ncbi:MAG: pre-rRNA processing protein, partial [Alectoria sarmentosa]
MSSFFTTPASQRKRKRDDANVAPPTKRRNTTKTDAKPPSTKPVQARRDESISSSGSEDEVIRQRVNDAEAISESEPEEDDETGAERRLRIAEQYLENIKGEVDEVGFDAEEIDKDLIAERLQEDVAETKGRLYRHIASTLDFSSATETTFRTPCLSTTSIDTCAPFAYTVHKDLTLMKWELPTPPPPPPWNQNPPKKPPRPICRRPIKLMSTRGDRSKTGDPNYQHHTAPILCVAASDTGKFVATGGADKRLIIWSADKLKPLRVFTQHRDAVTSLAFRRGTNQLYSSSKDRTIKIWDELAYLETLFGHQDEIVDVASLALERCVSVGARDRTARLWKVVEQTQLVFRGGGISEKRRPRNKDGEIAGPKSYGEGSIDRVALVDEETFITGSDNGNLSLWVLHKKKPIFTIPLAHGLDPPMKPEEASAEVEPEVKVPERQPRWITALATIPYSDVVLSGSWDGQVKIWRVSDDKKRLESMGVVGKVRGDDGDVKMAGVEVQACQEQRSVRGIINDLSVFERGNRGKDGLCIVAALGTEHRLGRWKKVDGSNKPIVFE